MKKIYIIFILLCMVLVVSFDVNIYAYDFNVETSDKLNEDTVEDYFDDESDELTEEASSDLTEETSSDLTEETSSDLTEETSNNINEDLTGHEDYSDEDYSEEYHGYWEVFLDDIEDDYSIQSSDEESFSNNLLQANNYSKYDSRDYNCITSIKDQGSYNTCWAFSALGSGEASMIKQGYASLSDEPDYSEYQLAYFLYNNKKDPLHNLDNDIVTNNTIYNFLNIGGSNINSAFALAGWVGATDEEVAPYTMTSGMKSLTNDYAFSKDTVHLQNAYIVANLSSESNISLTKKLIMDYGAVATGICFTNTLCKSISNTLENGDVAYNYNGSMSSNHAIMIIGWDDNFSKDNFKSGYKPTNDGAWLIKNSWGNDTSSYPYVWVSYEDICLSKNPAVAYVFEPADNYDYNYQYDGTYGLGYLQAYNPTIANVFTVSGGDVESIDAVSFALFQKNIDYSIQIYLNPTDKSNPESGVPMFATPQTGKTTYMGYMTIPLKESIIVNKGDTFAVVIKLSSKDFGYVRFFVDEDMDVYEGQLTFDNSVARGQSFYKSEGETYYHDCVDYEGGEDVSIRLKAYTNVISSGEVVDNTIDISKTDVSSIGDVSYTGKALTPEPTITYNGNTLKKNADYTLSYSNNVNIGTASITIKGINNYKGTKTISFNIRQGSVNMYRLYNPNSGEHFYTANSGERDYLVNVGWKYEGLGWKAPISSSSPVYRLYNPNAGDHHYTMSKSEKDFLVSVGWNYEGIGWYSDDSKTVPLYRQYNPNAISGSHNYTVNKSENDWLVSLGWRGEGIGWYGLK